VIPGNKYCTNKPIRYPSGSADGDGEELNPRKYGRLRGEITFEQAHAEEREADNATER
jgi:hypothetical protein